MSNHLEPQEKISARRTYTLLQQAFFKLLTEKPFEKITLKELCDTAMIPRSTFYRYFEDKYDLLGYCLQNFFENMDLDINVIYLKNLDAMKDYLAKTLKVLDIAQRPVLQNLPSEPGRRFYGSSALPSDPGSYRQIKTGGEVRHSLPDLYACLYLSAG